MQKKDFIGLADALRRARTWIGRDACIYYSDPLLSEIASFCKGSNPNFDKDRWLAYVRGECGPSGGRVQPQKERCNE